ncbi:lysoplasmalogenase [Shimia sp.]|uniref:lysoplasmalogenase n=1 Tax=Shimia sp. TaxID=1954381 RepID=UPI0032986401
MSNLGENDRGARMTFVEEIALRQSIRLALLTVGLVAAALYALFLCHRGPGWGKTIVKAIPMPAFGVAVAVSFGSPVIVGALALSALGDIALSRPSRRAFMVGLVGFALAHVAYIYHFWTLSGGAVTDAWLAVGALLIFAASTEVWLAPFTGDLKGPARIYVVLITLMGLTALGLPNAPLAVIGAFAFLASDTLLALQLFRMPETSRWHRLTSVLLWVLYVGGQFAILAGVGWATPLFQIW